MQATPARRRCALAVFTGALAAALPAADSIAQQSQRPLSSRRTVAAYDFEEPDNPFEVPADFFRAQSDPAQGIDRPGYPVFNQAAFDTDHARSGRRSILLPIERGSVALRLRPGAIPVFPDADYHVSCYVRSENTEHSRFRLVARLLDQNADPIPGAEITSSPILPEGRWQRVEVAVPGGMHAGAAFLQIDAELVQPERYREPSLDEHQIWPEDFQARAWIDDLTVSQLPRIWLRASTPGGIIPEPDQPELRFLVRDLTGERLTARLTITDARDRAVFTDTRSVRSSAVAQRWPIDLPRLGWYHARLEILAGDRVVGDAKCDLARVATTTARTDAEGGYADPDRARFELAVNTWNQDLLDALPQIGRATATKGITIAGWTSELTPATVEARTDRILDLLTSNDHQWADPAVALRSVPDHLIDQLILDSGDVLDALEVDRTIWADYLDPMLDRLGQIATRWRLGDSHPLADFGLHDGDLGRVRRELASLVPGPRIGLVQRPQLALPTWHAASLSGVTLALEPGTGTDVAARAIERWLASPLANSARLTLAYDTSDADRFAPDAVTMELVKRIILAEAAAAGTDADIVHQLVDPWSVTSRDGIVSPAPAVPAWRATIDRLTGRTVAAELAVAQGVRAFLLIPTDRDDPRGGALVAWNDHAPESDAWVRTNLGAAELTRVDAWGNTIGTVEPISLTSDGGHDIRLHELQVTPEPTFVEGIDVELAVFVASVRIDEPIIQTTPGPHERNVLITNPWPVAIDGDVIVLEPLERLPNGRRTGWDIAPRVGRFSVGPGETTAVPIELSFSAVEPAGPRPFVVDIAIRSGPIQERLRAPSAIELTLDGVELDARVVIDRSGTRLALEAVITNTAAEPADLVLHAATRGYPRQSASITDLAPGASTVRRFVYPDGPRRLAGAEIYVGVEDTVRRGRLNKRVSID